MILGITIAHTLLLCTIEKLFKSLLRFVDAELHILEVDKDDGDRYASCVGNVAGVEASYSSAGNAVGCSFLLYDHRSATFPMWQNDFTFFLCHSLHRPQADSCH